MNGIFDDFEAKITGDRLNGPFSAIGRYRSWVGEYRCGKRVGKWTYHNNVKNITKTMTYEDDLLEGLYESIGPTKIIRASYHKDKLHGTYIKHNFKNCTSTLGHYDNGLYAGQWTKRNVMTDAIIFQINYKVKTSGESVLHGSYIDSLYEGQYDFGVKIGRWVKRDKKEIAMYDGTGLSHHTVKTKNITLYQKLGGVCHGFFITNPFTPDQGISFYHLGRRMKTPDHLELEIKNEKYRLTYINEFGHTETAEFPI